MDDVSDAVSGNMGDITDDAASETELTGNSDINGNPRCVMYSCV